MYETRLPTLTVVGKGPIVVAALIVSGASLVNITRFNEAKSANLNISLACFAKMCEMRSSIPEVTVDTLLEVPEVIFSNCTYHFRMKASTRMFS